MPLTPEDEQLITRAVVAALAKWSAICALVGVVVWLLLTMIGKLADSPFFGGGG